LHRDRVGIVGGEIRDAAGAVLTTGEARWRRLGR